MVATAVKVGTRAMAAAVRVETVFPFTARAPVLVSSLANPTFPQMPHRVEQPLVPMAPMAW